MYDIRAYSFICIVYVHMALYDHVRDIRAHGFLHMPSNATADATREHNIYTYVIYIRMTNVYMASTATADAASKDTRQSGRVMESRVCGSRMLTKKHQAIRKGHGEQSLRRQHVGELHPLPFISILLHRQYLAPFRGEQREASNRLVEEEGYSMQA